jgi:sulfite oxidase
MRCAGHRRSEMTDMRPNVIRGVNYGPYAIYNVRYKGPRVSDVLKASGVDLNKVKDKHLWTTGFDEDFPGDPVQTSVVMSHVLDPRNEVILAIEANGEDIPEDHGYPVRILYPGFIGLRSTKWLCKMEIMDNESPCRFQQRAYKLYKEDTWAEVDTTKYPPPMGHVLNCVIAEPLKGDVVKCTVEHPYIEIKGVAVGEGGTGGRVTKVEIS